MFISGLAQTSLIAAIILAIAVFVELRLAIQPITWKSRALGGAFISAIVVSVAVVAFALNRLWDAVGVQPLLPPVEQWAGIAALPLTLLLVDFLKYWEHRFEHRFFWPVHRVHHAPTELHAMNNYGHPLHAVPLVIMVILPLSLLNFESLAIPVAVTIIFGVLNAISHSPIDLHFGPFRRLVIDNRFHRIHHSLEARHFDKNYGVIFPFWDMLFGTAYFPGPKEWPAVGVEGITPPVDLPSFLRLKRR